MSKDKDFQPTPNRLAGFQIDTLWGTAMAGIEMPEGIDEEQRFNILAAALALSTADGIRKHYLRKTAEGSEHNLAWMTQRLQRVCELTQCMWEVATAGGSQLRTDLTLPKTRKEGSAGKFDEGCVGDNYSLEIASTATPTGWGIPRIAILLEDKYGEDVGFQKAMRLLREAASESKSAEVLMCKFAERIYLEEEIDAKELIPLMLKAEIAVDQDSTELYHQVIDEMQEHCPKLWEGVMKLYAALPDNEDNSSQMDFPGWAALIAAKKR